MNNPKKRLNPITIGLICLITVGLIGLLFRWFEWPFSQLFVAVGFFGFPVLYGYLTWPIGKRIPDLNWVGTIFVMLLFGVVIFYKGL